MCIEKIRFDLGSAERQQGTYYRTVHRLYTGKSRYSRTAYEVEQHRLDGIVAMVSHGHIGSTGLPTLLLEPSIPQLPTSHLDRHFICLGIGKRIECHFPERDTQLRRHTFGETAIPQRLFSPQPEIAMTSLATITQLGKDRKQSHRIGPTAQTHQNKMLV